MNNEDVYRFFGKQILFSTSQAASAFSKAIRQNLLSVTPWDSSHEQGDALRNRCEMDEETAREKGILC